MSKHTPGPWKYVAAHGEFEMYKQAEIVGADEEGIAYPFPLNLSPPGRREANAERIVQCVNALEGVENPAEALRKALFALYRVAQSDLGENGERAATALKALGYCCHEDRHALAALGVK